MLKLAGLLALVVLILVGALMPLKYTERMRLPRKGTRPAGQERRQGERGNENRATGHSNRRRCPRAELDTAREPLHRSAAPTSCCRRAPLRFADRPALTFLLRGTLDEEPIVYRYPQLARASHASGQRVQPPRPRPLRRRRLPAAESAADPFRDLGWRDGRPGGCDQSAARARADPADPARRASATARDAGACAPGLDLWAKCAPIVDEVETLEHVLCVDPASLAVEERDHACIRRRVDWRSTISTRCSTASLNRASPSRGRSTRPTSRACSTRWHHRHAKGCPAHAGQRGLPRLVRDGHARHGPGQSILCGLPLFHVDAPLATGLAVWAAGGNVVLATPGGYRTPGLLPICGRCWPATACTP